MLTHKQRTLMAGRGEMPDLLPFGERDGNLLLPAVVLALAWWSTVHSRALEPIPGKLLRALALLIPFWAVFVSYFWASCCMSRRARLKTKYACRAQ